MVPFEMNERIQMAWEGFPPLPYLLMGWLWRVTGSINATGVLNYLALLAFLVLCHRKLRAPFFLVGLIALTAPLVLIHSATTYVDLFSNTLLAAAICVVAHVYLFERQESRSLLVFGLAGLVGAAWSRYQLVPLVGVFFLLYALTYSIWRGARGTPCGCPAHRRGGTACVRALREEPGGLPQPVLADRGAFRVAAVSQRWQLRQLQHELRAK